MFLENILEVSDILFTVIGNALHYSDVGWNRGVKVSWFRTSIERCEVWIWTRRTAPAGSTVFQSIPVAHTSDTKSPPPAPLSRTARAAVLGHPPAAVRAGCLPRGRRAEAGTGRTLLAVATRLETDW